MIPPRAALPAGVTNYVTPTGLEQLNREKQQLEEERAANTQENETERRRANMLIDGKLNLLNGRISSARVIDPHDQPKDEVRFGATVSLAPLDKKDKAPEMKFTITGVDEASVKQGKIAFVAPIAKAVSGKKVGEKVSLQLGSETRELRVLSINYD